MEGHSLFLSNHLPFYRLLIVRPSASRTQAVHVVLYIVEAELADLQGTVSFKVERGIESLRKKVNGRTW